MARSLQVQPEEHVTTSPLLIGFLILAGLVLTAGMVASAAGDETAYAGETVVDARTP